MSPLVAYGSVADTTTDPRWQRVTITARLAEPVIGLDSHSLCLDGPLSWCAATEALSQGVRLPPIQRDWTADLMLPLATWTAPPSRPEVDPRLLAADGRQVWGWACSRAHYSVLGYTATQVRRRPAVAEMARYSTAAKHHAGLGPHKARDTAMSTTIVDTLTWYALGDLDRLAALLPAGA